MYKYKVSFPIRLAAFQASGAAHMKPLQFEKRTAEPQNIECRRVESLSEA
jgi:hypothetical protein